MSYPRPDRSAWLFFTVAVLTLVFTLSAADSGTKVLRMTTYLYERVRDVERKAERSIDDREGIHDRLDRLDQAIRRMDQTVKRLEAREP